MREFGGAGVAGEAEQRAAHARIPVGRAEADEGRHQIDALHGIGFVGERAGLGGLLDDAEAVAQPLHRGARDEDRAFERVGAFAFELIGDGGEQLVLRGDRRRAGVEQRKAAGAVGRLDHARARSRPGRWSRPAGRRRCRRSRSAPPNRSGVALAELGGGILHLRQHRARHARIFSSSSSHCAGVDVEQQRARGVGGVGGVHLAAGEPPEQIAIDGAEHQLAALGACARAGDVVEDPGDLGAGEIGIDDQAGLLPRSPARGRRLSAWRRCRRCGGPARRWRGARPGRWRGPTPRWSRAGW